MPLLKVLWLNLKIGVNGKKIKLKNTKLGIDKLLYMMYHIRGLIKEEQIMSNKKYFYGNQISEYGVENGYVDYACLSKSFDAVLNNDIMSNTCEIGYWEQESGFIDNQDEIDELREKIDELENELYKVSDAYEEAELGSDLETEMENKMDEIQAQIDELNEEIDELENPIEPDVYQWFIVSDSGANILKDINEIVYYNELLDMYLWGVTHYGTRWTHVLTDIRIDW